MREFLKLFERRYSAVSTSDINNQLSNINNYNNNNNNNNNNINNNNKNNNNNISDSNNFHSYNNETAQKIRRKSLHSSRTLSRGFSIVDSFFKQRQNGKRPRWPKCVFLLLAFGIFCLSTFTFLYIVQPYLKIFKWKLVLTENGEIFDLWAKPPVDLYIKIYLFNITNAEEFLEGKEKMRVEQVGPYVYREMLTHENITFNPNGTLSTTPSHPLVWQEHLSEGHKEDDSFVLPNIALLSIAQLASERNYFFRLPINILIRNTDSQPLVKMTAKEFMFGFESPLTTLGNTLLPNWINFDKVGLIDRMYDFEGDFETFYTGETNIKYSGLYDTFRGSKNLPQWETDHCSNIHGASDGTKFKSFIEPNETLLFFRKSMCRPQRMVQINEPPTTVSGLSTQKYMFEDNALDNGRNDERNKCFCREGKCLPYGLVDVTSCYYGFPIALSYPHFLDADPKLVTDIEGSTPNRTEHESYFMIQPTSGLPLKLSVKFQINLAMKDVSNMAHVERFSHITIPMVWFEIAMLELPVSLQNRFNLYLNILPVVEEVAQWGTLAIGIILLISAITKTANKLCSTSQRKMSLQNRYHSMQLKTSVYMPCEEKINDDLNLSKCIRVNDYMTTIELIDENKGIIEQEPVLSGSDIEGDGNESQCDNDTGHGSSTDDRDSNDGDDTSSNASKIKDNTSTTSSGVSSKQATSCRIWDIEQRSSIDDMSNDIFIELRINEDDRISIASEDSISYVLDKIKP